MCREPEHQTPVDHGTESKIGLCLCANRYERSPEFYRDIRKPLGVRHDGIVASSAAQTMRDFVQ
ncbi:MAG: hypothetical protein AMXMBFR84_26450 [Candidatus Hydrogenedentota bacterium]